MKRIIAFLLIVVLCCSIVACGNKQSDTSDKQTDTNNKQENTDVKNSDTEAVDKTANESLMNSSWLCTYEEEENSFKSLALQLYDGGKGNYIGLEGVHSISDWKATENGVWIEYDNNGTPTEENFEFDAANVLVNEDGIRFVNRDIQVENEEIVVYTREAEPVDLVTVSEVVIIPFKNDEGNLDLEWKIKLTNTSGQDLKMNENGMTVWYNYLDENYDIIHSDSEAAGYNSTIKEGRSEWLRIDGRPFDSERWSNWTDSEMEKIAYIEIYGYALVNYMNPTYEFEEIIEIDLSEYFEWDDLK